MTGLHRFAAISHRPGGILVVSALSFATLGGCRTVGPEVESALQSTEELSSTVAQLVPDYFFAEDLLREIGYGVVRSPVGAVVLVASTCDRALALATGLGSPRPELDVPNKVASPVLRSYRSTGNWCELNVDGRIDPYLAQTLSKSIDDSSVQTNCWAHALMTARVVPTNHEVKARAFSWVLEKQCRQLTQAEPLQRGDVIAIRAVQRLDANLYEFEEVHAAAVLSDELWASKYGAGPQEIKSPRLVLLDYLTSEHEECMTRSPDELSSDYLDRCQSLVQAFRCSTWETTQAEARERSGTPHFDQVYAKALPFLWILTHDQWMMEKESPEDRLILPGSAYVSRSYPDPIAQALHDRGEESGDLPEFDRDFVVRLKNSEHLRAKFPLAEPVVAPLPEDLVEGDFEARMEAYNDVRGEVQRALATPGMSIGEAGLLKTLGALLQGSQYTSDEDGLFDEWYQYDRRIHVSN